MLAIGAMIATVACGSADDVAAEPIIIRETVIVTEKGEDVIVKETVIVTEKGETLIVKEKGDTVTVTEKGETIIITETAVPINTQAPAAPAAAYSRVDIAVQDIRFAIGTPRFSRQDSYNAKAGIAEPLVMAVWTDDTKTELVAKPLIAKSWSVSPDLTFAEFVIEEGIKFHPHNGVSYDLTAEDVAWSYNDANSAVQPESVHDTAGDLAANFQEMEVLAGNTVKVPFVVFSSHFLLRNLSSFWEAPSVKSKSLFDELGAEGMRDVLIGTGPLKVVSWVRNGTLVLAANEDYHGASGMPTIDEVRVIEVTENSVRAAMLETGQVGIANIALTDFEFLLSKGFTLAEEGFRGVSAYAFGGNWWEDTSIVTGQPLERTTDLSKPWISGSKESDPERWESARLVRQALGHAIKREDILTALFAGQGSINYVPGWDADVPGHKDEWKYPYDPDEAKSLLSQAGYPDGGFTVDIWVGPSDTNAQLAEAIGGQWNADLNIDISIDKQVYGTYRPTIINRSTTKVWGCGTDGVNVPLTWPKGFLVSSISAGGFMCGTEHKTFGQIYLDMAGSTDSDELTTLAMEFFDEMRYVAPQVGIVSTPRFPLVNPAVVESWEMLPEGKGVLGGMNNLHRITLK